MFLFTGFVLGPGRPPHPTYTRGHDWRTNSGLEDLRVRLGPLAGLEPVLFAGLGSWAVGCARGSSEVRACLKVPERVSEKTLSA